MDCPFPLEYDDDMSDEDPEVDADVMKTSKRQNFIEDKSDFEVKQKPVRRSEFDEETKKKEASTEEERLLKQITIDDD